MHNVIAAVDWIGKVQECCTIIMDNDLVWWLPIGFCDYSQ